jgi:hypothetical protein
MSSLTGLSPNNPRDYVGPNVALNTVVTRNRAPTGADYRQPETGKLYPFNTFWLVGKNPTTGTQGDLWYLSKIVANVAYWSRLATGATGDGPVLTLTGTIGGAIDPDVNGNINIVGSNGVGVVGSGNTLTASVTNWIAGSTNNWTPTIAGSTAAGTATYTFRNAVYSRVGNMVFFMIDMTWTGHTGTGNMLITGFPIIFALSSANYPTPIMVQNLTLPAGSVEVFFNGTNGATQGSVVTTVDATTVASVPMAGNTAGTISCQGFYYSNAANP